MTLLHRRQSLVNGGNEGSFESNQGVQKSKRVRKTGAQCPWGFAQIFALIILGLNFLATIILDLPSLACALEDFGLFLFAVQVVLQISSIVVAVICASKDPTDPIIYEQRALKITGQDFNDENFEYFCDKCDAHVNDNTKHCNRCNRCTKEFDHHCIWLNNCVGYNNYRDFCILIGIMMTHAILAFIIKIYLCAKVYGSGASDFEVQTNLIYYYQKYFGITPHQNSLMAFGVSIGVLNFIISLAMTYLVVYHIWLKIQGLTTYQHILLQRERINKMRQSYLETCDDIEEINEQYSHLRQSMKQQQQTMINPSGQYDNIKLQESNSLLISQEQQMSQSQDLPKKSQNNEEQSALIIQKPNVDYNQIRIINGSESLQIQSNQVNLDQIIQDSDNAQQLMNKSQKSIKSKKHNEQLQDHDNSINNPVYYTDIRHQETHKYSDGNESPSNNISQIKLDFKASPHQQNIFNLDLQNCSPDQQNLQRYISQDQYRYSSEKNTRIFSHKHPQVNKQSQNKNKDKNRKQTEIMDEQQYTNFREKLLQNRQLSPNQNNSIEYKVALTGGNHTIAAYGMHTNTNRSRPYSRDQSQPSSYISKLRTKFANMLEGDLNADSPIHKKSVNFEEYKSPSNYNLLSEK
eukprot:403349149